MPSEQEAKKDVLETEFTMVSEKFGFSLAAPGSWKGKVEISKEDESLEEIKTLLC